MRRATTELAGELTRAAGAGAADVQRALSTSEPATANVLAWADALVAVAQRMAGASSAAAAEAEVADLVRLARQLTFGIDADGDGRITPGDAPGLLALRMRVRALVAHRAGLAAAGVEGGR